MFNTLSAPFGQSVYPAALDNLDSDGLSAVSVDVERRVGTLSE